MKLEKKTKVLLASACSVIVLSFAVTSAARTYSFFRPAPRVPSAEAEHSRRVEEFLDGKYGRRTQILKPLPYGVKNPSLDVWAASAICVDVKNGNIVYEKNADEVIPPASMTKLFLMYVVFKEIERGRISLDDVVPIGPESFACNMPPRSSLMFLGKNQIVTLDELLMGLSISSGNDAAHAIAHYVSGGMDEFIALMNAEAERLGLENTFFVESSGYSEKNTTTAREMATFSREYLFRFPEAVKYHSALGFSYPKEKNLAVEDRGRERSQDFSSGIPERITMEIHQNNTNPLLPVLKGCDGLKTGYIEESGYNLALTCTRNDVRFLSVTMRGPGSNSVEGQKGRVHDGTEIMEWAFGSFREYRNPSVLRQYSIPLFNSEYPRANLVPAWKSECLTVPVSLAQNSDRAEEEVSVDVKIPRFMRGRVLMGEEYGKIEYSLGGVLLETIPLVADRDLKKASWWLCASDFLAELAYRSRL